MVSRLGSTNGDRRVATLTSPGSWRYSPWWCRTAGLAPFVVLGALALASCGGDATEETAEEAEVAASDDAAAEESGADDGAVDDGAADEPTDDAGGDDAVEELFPDVLEAMATSDGDGTWTFSATLSSPYDSPSRYADAWRVVGPDGTVYGERILTHDHANEQPFTRSQSGIEIPEDVTMVTVEGRDQLSGWGGATFEVDLTAAG